MNVDSIKAAYRSALNERGETVTIRRYTGLGANRPRFDVECMAVVTGYAAEELVGSIVQGDRKVILLTEDLIDAQFAIPVTKHDKVVVRGDELQIIAPDDSSRRVAGVLIAYELTARG